MNIAVHVLILKMILQSVFDAFEMKSVKICDKFVTTTYLHGDVLTISQRSYWLNFY